MSEVPKTYANFNRDFPEISEAYSKLGTAVHQSGPLDDKTRALIKLGMSCAAQKEGAVHSHTRKAVEAGCTEVEIRQVVVLMLPTLGFPAMMSAMTWVNDVLDILED